MLKKKVYFSPYITILMSFLIVILIGGGILSLPFVTISGKGTKLIEGIFTATSAVCVTGLTVNDVSTTYNLIGKTIILILIQLGGIGLITFSSLLILLVSKEISYYTKKVVQEDINAETVFNIHKYIIQLFFGSRIRECTILSNISCSTKTNNRNKNKQH